MTPTLELDRPPRTPERLGVVVIGRNEGDRLRRCLDSVCRDSRVVVYVDSGSTDGSVERCRARSVAVVELDLSTPFTAARARNAGAERLLQLAPGVAYIQFVDGDCELCPDWLSRAESELAARADWAAVCGRLRERYPEATIYNRLCEIEWNGPVGEIAACGGNAMIRASAFAEVGGFDPAVIAAEDDELCLRLRRNGWRVARLAADMGFHDAAMTRFAQWWTRAVRCGYAYALGAQLHGQGPERHFVREKRRAIVWGAVVPIVAVLLAAVTQGWSLLLFAPYPFQLVRAYRAVRPRAQARSHAAAYATSCVLAKTPQVIGILRHARDRLWRRPARIIEHK